MGYYPNEQEFTQQHLSGTPPDGVALSVGDMVTLTNPQDVVFPGQQVIGFSQDGLYKYGNCVHLAGESSPYWYPFHPSQLVKEQAA